MNSRSTFIFGLLVISGCRDAAVPEADGNNTSSRTHLERLIKKSGEVRFHGWNGTQNNDDGSYFHMSFLKDSNVKLEVFGYNVDFVSGSYRFVDDATIKVTFTNQDYTEDWPLLRLTEEGGDLLISRDDGKTAWHMNWPLSPEVIHDIWPVRTLIEKTEHDGDSRAYTPESPLR